MHQESANPNQKINRVEQKIDYIEDNLFRALDSMEQKFNGLKDQVYFHIKICFFAYPTNRR